MLLYLAQICKHKHIHRDYSESEQHTQISHCYTVGCTGCRCIPKMSMACFFSSLKITHVVQHASVYHNETTLAATDAFSGLLMRPKCISGRGSARTPLGELTALPQIPSWWGGARCRAPPQETFPALGLRPRISALRASGMHPKTNSWLRCCCYIC